MIKVGCIVEDKDGYQGRVVHIYWTASSCAGFCYIRSIDVEMLKDDALKNYFPKAVKVVKQG